MTEVPEEDTNGSETVAIAAPEPEPEPMIWSTTPVPVPQPAIPRAELPEPLQLLWTRVERSVEVRPPDPPAEGTIDGIRAWGEGPFATWLAERGRAMQEAEDDVDFLAGAAPHERAVAAGLFGYMYEDTAAAVSGAPVPTPIAEDNELLDLYRDTLVQAIRPYAQSSAEAYATCAQILADLGDRAWYGWGQYCRDRGRDVIESYQLVEPPTRAEDGD